MGNRTERLELSEAARDILTESRMVLPGIQTLFGFQLIAVFSDRFDSALTQHEKILHLSALCLIALAVAVVMAPAAYHREVEREEVSETFITLASRLLLLGMLALVGGITLDFYLVLLVVVKVQLVAAAIAAALLAVFLFMWLVLPRIWSKTRG